MPKLTIRDVDVAGKKVLVRVDFNVPIDAVGRITDDTRIRASLPTINYLVEHGAKVILMTHLGRPKGRVKNEFRLAPVARRLGEILNRQVPVAADCVGPQVEEMVNSLAPGEIILLENLRFHPEEEANDSGFSRQLAALADLYVNDAFGTAHRAHASTVGVAAYLPAVSGLLMEKEINFLEKIVTTPPRPLVACLGGAKVSDKLGVISNLLRLADQLLIGGGMANTFFLAQGYDVGKSLVEAEQLPAARQLLEEGRDKVLLPEDVVVAQEAAAEATPQVVEPQQVPEDHLILDIGPRARERFAGVIAAAGAVVWNGPMGVFEVEPFAAGTRELARAVAACPGITVVGGGDSLAAVEQAGVSDRITHLSTGGGATLEFLEGKTLPGVAVLQDK